MEERTADFWELVPEERETDDLEAELLLGELDSRTVFSVFLSSPDLDLVFCASTVNAMNTNANIMVKFFMTQCFGEYSEYSNPN